MPAAPASDDDDGVHAGAILMLALGEECAAEVFKHLSPREVQRLGERMARVTTVADQQFDDVLTRFESSVQSQLTLVNDSGAYVSNVLKLALGENKAGLLIDRIVQSKDDSGIDNLKWMEAPAVADLVRREHPQVIASILVHLEREQAAGVLEEFDDALRSDVMMRVATLDTIHPNAMQELNEVLSRVLAGGLRARKGATGGPKAAAEMLGLLGAGKDTRVMDTIRGSDEALAQKIDDLLFSFDDLLKLDNKGMQTVLREVASDALIVALKGADPAMREKVFSNMSSRAAETLREDLDAKGPVRLSDVEAQQKEILKTVRRLADEGTIMFSAGGGESFV